MTTAPNAFDSIRPYNADEMPEALSRLFADEAFRSALAHMPGDLPPEALEQACRACRTPLELQKRVIYPILKALIEKTTASLTMNAEAIDSNAGPYTYVSNHRDIVLDSAFLSFLLLDNGFPNTVEIAIGDNLLAAPWIETFVRLNKSFLVHRSLSMHEMLRSSRLMSAYMHYAVQEKNESIWIAQREGRAKNSDDRTQESLLKMMALDGRGTLAESLISLHIAPLAISYEFDPCDFLKAKEMQQRRNNPDLKKTKEDDVRSMRTGLLDYKGRVSYCVAPCLSEWIAEIAPQTPRSALTGIVARRIDNDIHSRYTLYPINYAAYNSLEPDAPVPCPCNKEELNQACEYIESRIALVDLPDKDDDFLREKIREMYANPLRNHLAARSR